MAERTLEDRMTGTGAGPRVGTPRVAVIAVHGVADQKPNDACTAIASMLAEHTTDPRNKDAYSPFVGHETHLPQNPVVLNGQVLRVADVTERQSDFRDVFHITERREYTVKAEQNGLAEGELGFQFMKMQLEEYVPGPDSRTNVTTVLSGKRLNAPSHDPAPVSRITTVNAPSSEPPATAGGPEVSGAPADVDIYEVHWADLSRLASGPFAFLGASYQVLLHIATLGRQAVDDAAVVNYATGTRGEKLVWPLMNFLQRWAVRFLTLPVPMLNVVLVVVTLGIIPITLVMKASWGPDLAVGLVSGVLGAFIGYRIARRRVPHTPDLWAIAPLISATLMAALFLTAVRVLGVKPISAVTACWWVVGAAFVFFVAGKYERMRPGAILTTALGYAFALSAFVLIAMADPSPEFDLTSVERATMQTMEATFALLRLSWFVLLLCVVGLVVLWPAAWLVTRKSGPRWSKGRAALRTGRLAISLSATAFLLLTILGWAGLFAFAVEKFAPFADTGVSTLPDGVHGLLIPDSAQLARLDLITARNFADSATFTPPEYFQGFIAESVTASGPISLGFVIAAILLLMWMALPSIMTEMNSPTSCTNAQSRQMGWWLSRGLDATRWVGHLLLLASCILPLTFGLLYHRGPLIEITYTMVGNVGTSIAASAVVVLTLLAKYGGSALDVMLDVDNYMRTTPAEATPRARIAERYVSVLRHIASDGPDGKQRYDRVVIVAHSLGALISVELLKFLKQVNMDPSLARLGFGPPPSDANAGERIPIILMTMGNPLRQLLCRFFPHRYDWVRLEPDNGATPLQPVSSATPVSTDPVRPQTSLIGLSRWESAYRSGDYVGRSVWLDEWYDRNTVGDAAGTYPEEITHAVPPADASNAFAEYCIGAGGHTHYWDHTAPDIADRLDALIADG